MDNLEYLQQISQSNRPSTPAKSTSLPMALIGKILLGALVLIVVLIGVGVLANNSSDKAEDLTQQLYLRINNVDNTITNTTQQLKSSQLRSISVSLSGILTNTANQLTNYATSHNEDNKKDPLAPKDEVLASETAVVGELEAALTNAKLNGILDRIYTTQIHLQVSLLLSMASELSNRSNDAELLQILSQFRSSLSVIEESLNNYSNPSA